MTLEEMIDNSSRQCSLRVSIDRKAAGRGRVLLKNIRAEFKSGDFVLILGGSGTGKTTLVKAILGEDKAEGSIILDGQDLYKNLRQMRGSISIVPQFLTLRLNDTVRSTLEDTAAIKLGRVLSRGEQRRRVDHVLESLGITEQQNKYISQLSGGQQKKVAVADQLIGFQQVFICDEPDSGLDAASRIQQMEILREISRRGRIVMVISHEPDDAALEDGPLFDKVIVLAKSDSDTAGQMAFCGSAKEALSYFGVGRLQDIMLLLNPVSEGGCGRADEFISGFARRQGV